MGLRENPRLKRKSGCEGSDGDKGLVLGDDALLLLKLLSDDVTEDASILIMKVFLGPLNLFCHPDGQDRKGNNLGMGMLQGSASGCAGILEDENVSKPRVPSQIDDPLTIGLQDIFNGLEW